jgi:hypothetical protein
MGLNRHLEWDQRSDGLAPDYECLSICIAKMGCRSEAAIALITLTVVKGKETNKMLY